MASHNRHHAGQDDHLAAYGNSASVAVTLNRDEIEASGEMREDDILYQMDQELDMRLNYLCQLSAGQTPSSVARNTVPSTNPRSFTLESDMHQGNVLHETSESFSTLSVGDTYAEEQSCERGNGDRNTMVKKNSNISNSLREIGAQECTQESNDEGCSPFYSESELVLKSSASDTQDLRNGTTDKSENNVETKYEVDDEREDCVFDEFLDHSTRLRIGLLTKKVTALTEALKLSQEECKSLSQAKRNVSTAAQVAERERRNMSKQVQTLQQESSKLQKSNKHSQQRVKELTGECQALRKELSSTRQSECERRNAQSSYEAQLTRSRADNAALRDQMADLKTRHKAEVDQLRTSIATSSTRVKELERQQRNFSALVKKQEKLITVLNEQKNNMAAAKAVAGLEDKFLAVISPLQPP